MKVRRIQGLMYDDPENPGQPAPDDTQPEDGGTVLSADDAVARDDAEDSDKATDAYDGFELKLPDQSRVSEERASKILSEAKEQGLPPAAAQKLVENEHSALVEYEAAQAETLKASREEWVNSLKKDPVWGGDKWNETVQMAKRGLEAHGDAEIGKFLETSGLGDHPAVVKLFARLGKMGAEDKMVRAAVRTKATDRSLADILYGGGEKG